ncbi:hypothetical protein Patl1_09489 [Pistacia atlantica]|uniref:Uncharacterized protein n=1 Tax=Pistacia atlantica TaxID=434234 RepID=A0ACC1AK10_9ROSI|nr:hypothetical protein Patl1_09489 [Pistacia atlantica]
MDRYQRVEKPKAETPIDENEIRITSQGRMRSYITYAMTLLQLMIMVKFVRYSMVRYLYEWRTAYRKLQERRNEVNSCLLGNFIISNLMRFNDFMSLVEKGSNEVVFKAMGRAINKTVTIVELIKRRIVGLHQNTAIGSTDITDMWEPLEEGLLPLETTRHVSMITITLSKKELNTSSVGYQLPLPAEQVRASTEFDYDGEGSPSGRRRGRLGRGRSRGRGNGFVPVEYEDGVWDRNNRGYARGRNRGRGRSFRGRGRGGYNGPYVDGKQDGYYNEAPAQGSGRGRGRGYRGRGRGYRSNGPIQAAA